MLKYEEFKINRANGTIIAGIDNSIAMRLIDRLPKKYQYAHLFWSWVWMLSIFGFIAVSIFYKWWLGILLLLFITPTLFSSAKKAAAKFVLQHAEDDREFFDFLVSNELLIFRK